MTDREKLVELLTEYFGVDAVNFSSVGTRLVDHLISHGVTFAKDINVPCWIPVTERLPEDGQTVIACVTHRFGDKSIIPMVFWHESYFHWKDVTHWMPLPEPPKEGE